MMKIMIVEDDETVRELVSESLHIFRRTTRVSFIRY